MSDIDIDPAGLDWDKGEGLHQQQRHQVNQGEQEAHLLVRHQHMEEQEGGEHPWQRTAWPLHPQQREGAQRQQPERREHVLHHHASIGPPRHRIETAAGTAG